MNGFSWDAPYLNTFDYSWEQHPNVFENIQDDDTYLSFSPPRQDWNDTFINTFDQSWEGNFEHFYDFQDHGFTSFVSNNPPENIFEQPEPSHSFETFSPSLTENFTTFLGNFTSSLEALNTKMGQLVDELKNQSQGSLPSDNEKSKCFGKDESDIEKELEIFEANFKHTSKTSLLPNSEEVLQDAKIPNVMIFAHCVQPSFCDHNIPFRIMPWTVGRICVIKSSGILPISCSLGGELVGRSFGMVEVSIILKPLHFLKMHMWGGEPHPT